MSKCMNESMSSEMSMSGEMNMSMNSEMKTICTDCVHASNCTKQFDKNERKAVRWWKTTNRCVTEILRDTPTPRRISPFAM